jgi:predicted CopG family antitoxin
MAKTTVMLREEVYEVLKKNHGARGMSKAISEILAGALLRGESMFDTVKKKAREWGPADSIVLGAARMKRTQVLMGDEYLLSFPETACIG